MKPQSPCSAEDLDSQPRWNREDCPPSIAVIEAIADVRGVEPTDLDGVLYDLIDPEALDALFLGEKPGDIEVELPLGSHRVTIRSDGSLQVQEEPV